MSKRVSTLILFTIISTSIAYAQSTTFTGTTWVINEYYLNGIKFDSTAFDSLSLRFRTDGFMEIRTSPTVVSTSSYTYNPTAALITVRISSTEFLYFKILHSDLYNLIVLLSPVNDFSSPAPVAGATYLVPPPPTPTSELRMIPNW